MQLPSASLGHRIVRWVQLSRLRSGIGLLAGGGGRAKPRPRPRRNVTMTNDELFVKLMNREVESLSHSKKKPTTIIVGFDVKDESQFLLLHEMKRCFFIALDEHDIVKPARP